MSKIEDFRKAPIGATATYLDGSRVMKMGDGEWGWITPVRFYYDDEEMVHWGCTLDPPYLLPTREEIADVIIAEILFGSRTAIAAADAVLALLKGQEV